MIVLVIYIPHLCDALHSRWEGYAIPKFGTSKLKKIHGNGPTNLIWGTTLWETKNKKAT